MKSFWFLCILVIAGLAALGCDGQRSCPSDFSCAELVTLTCGESGQCATAQSCVAAKRLENDATTSTCEAAWCSLGEAYRECDK